MIYVGIDVHKIRSTIVALDPSTGEYAEENVHSNCEDLVAALEKLPEPFVVGVEATLFSPALTAWLRGAGMDVRLLDPQALKECSKRKRAKTDRIDAMLMARALAEGWDVECYLAEEEVLQLRALTRGRVPLVSISTKLRNCLRSLLFQQGVVLTQTDLRGAAARELVPRLIKEQFEDNVAVMAALYWSLLGNVEDALHLVGEQIKAEVARHPVASRLEKASGAGPVTALTIVAEIGRVDRFACYKHLHSYAGLTPTTHESADTRRPGHLPQECNKHLRNAVITVAQGAARCKAPNKAKTAYERTKRRCGPNTGKIAAGRKVLTDAYFLWRQVTE